MQSKMVFMRHCSAETPTAFKVKLPVLPICRSRGFQAFVREVNREYSVSDHMAFAATW